MSSEEIIVEISDGFLRGKKCISVRNNFPYFSFQGIPYAQPPVGNLRFKVSKIYYFKMHSIIFLIESKKIWISGAITG